MAVVNGVPISGTEQLARVLDRLGHKAVVHATVEELAALDAYRVEQRELRLLDLYTSPTKTQYCTIPNGGKPDVPTLPRHAHPQDFLRGIRPVKSQDRGAIPHWR